ncbi:MAG: glycosyltransferase [Enterocloster clostridioformis]
MGALTMYKEYSVLMSVYQKEYPSIFRAAITSIVNQTLKAKEFVLVCDGPLTNALEQVLDEFSNILILVRLEKNVGLGMALAEGMRYCNCEWIVRMDRMILHFQTDVKTNYICSTASGNRCIKWNGGGI